MANPNIEIKYTKVIIYLNESAKIVWHFDAP